MGEVVHFPAEAQKKLGFERVKSNYTVREISVQFGISERYIKRWTQEGIIPAAAAADGEPRYDFRALSQFRGVRELRNKGLTLRQIDAELHGQMNLFPAPAAVVIPIPSQLSPFEEALLLHERGDKRAQAYYGKAITENDYPEDAWCNLGILEFDAGNIAKAFDCFTHALKADPRHFEAHFNLGYLYFETSDLRLARVHYEMAAEIEPGSPSVYFNLGLINAMSGDLTAAVAALSRAKTLTPEDEQGRIDELLARIQDALRHPDRQSRRQPLKKTIAADAVPTIPFARNTPD